MKKIRFYTALIALVLFSTTAKAQFKKGDVILGGGIYFYTSGLHADQNNNPLNNYTSNSYISGLAPKLFIAGSNSWLYGFSTQLGYSYSKYGNTSTSKNSYYNITFVLSARKQKLFNEHFGWYIEGSPYIGFNKQKQSSGTNATESSWRSTGINIYPGLVFKVSPRVFVDGSFGGFNTSYDWSNDPGSKRRTFRTGINFPSNFSFGIQLRLNKD